MPDLQLERDGYLLAATTDTLAQVVARLDPSRLVAYECGNPAGIVRHIDSMVMRVCVKPM